MKDWITGKCLSTFACKQCGEKSRVTLRLERRFSKPITAIAFVLRWVSGIAFVIIYMLAFILLADGVQADRGVDVLLRWEDAGMPAWLKQNPGEAGSQAQQDARDRRLFDALSRADSPGRPLDFDDGKKRANAFASQYGLWYLGPGLVWLLCTWLLRPTAAVRCSECGAHDFAYKSIEVRPKSRG